MPTHSCTSEKKLESLYTRKNEVEKLQTDHQKSRLPICQSSVPLLLSLFLPESPYIPLSSIEILIFGVSNRLSFFLSVSTIPYLQITMGNLRALQTTVELIGFYYVQTQPSQPTFSHFALACKLQWHIRSFHANFSHCMCGCPQVLSPFFLGCKKCFLHQGENIISC